MMDWKRNLFLIGFVSMLALPIGMIWGGHVLEHSPSFCNSCHEMQASYEGWLTSGAANNHPTCIECHKGEGFSSVIESELRGLRMIGVHFWGHSDPNEIIKVKMPEAYCLKCHSGEKVIDSHALFQTKRSTCSDCHKHRIGWKFKGQVAQ